MNTPLPLLPDTDTVELILLLVNNDAIIQLEHYHVFFTKRENNSKTLTFLLF